MTVSSSVNKTEYTGDGVSTVFSFPYIFYSNSDIKVYFNGVLQSSGYTVSGAGNSGGGNVTFSIAPTNGVEIVIIRIVSYIQNTDFTDFDGNPSTVTERAFDILTMQTQQLAESQGRVVSVSIGSGLSSTTLPDPAATTSYLSATLAGGFEWKQLASISGSIDTELSGLTTNDLLIYNGTNWKNTPTIAAANIPNNSVALSKLSNNFIASATAKTITASDLIIFGDASDSNNSKRDTVQTIVDIILDTFIGFIHDFGGGTVPAKFLLCDGAAISRTTYSKLFAAIGTTWGAGDGSTTFNVPDMRRRVPVGSGGTGTSTLQNTVGSVGGAETHTLTTSEMPSQPHDVPISGTSGGYTGYALGGTGSALSPLSTTSVGGGQAHNNMQPSAVFNMVIYAGV